MVRVGGGWTRAARTDSRSDWKQALGNRELLKVSYSWLRSAGQTGSATDVLGFELVTHFTPRQWAIR